MTRNKHPQGSCSEKVVLPTFSSKEQQSHVEMGRVEDTGEDGTNNDAKANLL